MGLTLIMAEKPSQARSYADAFDVKNKTKTYIELKPCSIFPEGATITWGVGHLVSLKMPGEYKEEWQMWNLKNLPIFPDTFEYKVSSNVKDQFKAVKKLFDAATTLINACDVDREGSNIFYSTLYMTGYKNSQKPIKRLWINSLERDEVKKGFTKLLDNQKDILMYEEAKARQQADWLVGMNASQLYTLLLQQKGYSGSLSIGRVQSPTVYLIYQRQKEIDNFVTQPFFEIEATFTAEQGYYKGKANVKEDAKEKVQALLDQYRIAGKEQGVVASVEKNEKRKKASKLHSLSTLQSKANKQWKYSPKKVLDIVQRLYDKKVLSYPRTDCNYITDSEFAYLKDNLKEYQCVLQVEFTPKTLEPNKRFVDGAKVEEHYAIIPTKTIPSEKTLQSFSDEERNIYREVVATMLGMFHEDYIYEETTILTHVNGLPFKSTGKTEKVKGWQTLFPAKKQDKEEKEKEAVLPNVSEKETVQGDIRIKERKTKPPKPYSEGQLINMMKTCGKHVEQDEDVEILKEIEGLGTEATRSGIIERIKQQKYVEIKKNVATVTDKGKILCEAIEGTLLSSPTMTAKWESYLTKIGKGEGASHVFMDKIKQFIQQQIHETPDKLNGKEIQEKIQTQQHANSIGRCPLCNGDIQDKGKFYGCSGYKDGCTFTLPKRFLGKTISAANMKKILAGSKTSLIKGFKSKKGKTFNAYLRYDSNEGRLKPEFQKG
ncbi:type IA DNA topoisomerase [Virgibacillus ihumii]|uniref:type IA DNA topoisomerase n=1 Tax=Virgibacillus ihumii TaxID=2686091 RepID=UPI00157BCA7D|nr:type IA DNA topoisomerase [Virgibacillus ihumii]